MERNNVATNHSNNDIMHSHKVKYHMWDKYIVYPKMAWKFGIGRLSKITPSRERLFLIGFINSGEHVDNDMYFIV